MLRLNCYPKKPPKGRDPGSSARRAKDQWAPGYYSTLFEDPDGIRLELDHVPGWGLLGDTRGPHGSRRAALPRSSP
jgi:hypothetical protein